MFSAEVQVMVSFMRDSSMTGQRLRRGSLRRMLRYARPYRLQIGVYLAMTVLSAGILTAIPVLLQVIIDHGILRRDTAAVLWVAGTVAGLAVMNALLEVGQRWYSARVGEGLIYDLRTEVFGHVQRQPVAFFTRAQTGSLVSRLNGDIISAQQALTSTLAGVVSNIVSLVLALAVMLWLSWPVTVSALVLIPLLVIPARLTGRRLQRLTREGMQLDAEMGAAMTERFNVAGAMLVKLFGDPASESRMFARRAARVRDVGVTTAMYGMVLFAGMTLLASLAMAVAYGLGGALVIRGTFQLGALVALAALLGRLYGPVTVLSNVQADVMTALVSFDRVFEVLDLKPMISERPGASPLTGNGSGAEPALAPEVSLDRVSFRYPAAGEVSPVSAAHVLVGAVLHFAYSGFLGVAFAMVIAAAMMMRVPLMRTAGGVTAAGVAGGAVVYAAMRWGLLPLVNPLMALVPQTAFFLAHLLFGLVAGVVLAVAFRRRSMIGAPAPAGHE